MPAYNFKVEFASLVESGYKRQTIRKKRKRPTQIGDILYLYTGMRTRGCRGLGKAICLNADSITIDRDSIIVAGRELGFAETLGLYRNDGFPCLTEFFGFFESLYGLPFEGVLLKW